MSAFLFLQEWLGGFEYRRLSVWFGESAAGPEHDGRFSTFRLRSKSERAHSKWRVVAIDNSNFSGSCPIFLSFFCYSKYIAMITVLTFCLLGMQHAGLLHLGLSTWALLEFGPAVESAYGTLGFSMIYLIGGLYGNLLSFFHTPQGTVGATVSSPTPIRFSKYMWQYTSSKCELGNLANGFSRNSL